MDVVVAALQNIKIEADAMKLRFLNEISAHVAKLASQMQPPVEEQGSGASSSNTASTVLSPKPVVKSRKTVSIKTLNSSSTWQIETEEDVDKYISVLQTKLKALLEKDTIINIEF